MRTVELGHYTNTQGTHVYNVLVNGNQCEPVTSDGQHAMTLAYEAYNDASHASMSEWDGDKGDGKILFVK